MRSDTHDVKRPAVVSICDPSNAGKSQLAKAVVAAVGEHRCARIPTDYFLLFPPPQPEAPAPLGLGYDWPLIDRLLTRPVGTEVTTPDVDFERLVRRSPHGGLPFVVRPLVLTDGFAPHPAATLRVLLTAPEPLRRLRAADRDRPWNSRVIDRWPLLERSWTMAAARVSTWDLCLNGEAPVARNAERLERALAHLHE
jgi:hypothetical protein